MTSTFMIGTSPFKFLLETYRVFADSLIHLQCRLFINIAEQKTLADVFEGIIPPPKFFMFI